MIPLFRPVYNKGEVLKEIGECLDKGWTGLGYKTIQFEEAWKKYTKLPNAHFLNSATSGLHLALELAQRRRPNKFNVLTTPLTFVSTNHAIRHAGLSLDFVDVDDSLCMDPIELEKKIKYYRDCTVAVIFVGIGGNPGQLEKVAKICNLHGIPLILDASHMAGSLVYDYASNSRINPGFYASYTVFSFQAVKNLSTGDGGMLCCIDPDEDKLARRLSWLGIDKDTWNRTEGGGNWEYEVDEVGWKYHGNSITASLGLVGLKSLDDYNKIRSRIKSAYDAGLYPEYTTICNPRYTQDISSHHLYQLLVRHSHKRDKVITYARKHGIQLGVHYKINTDYPPYRYAKESCPNAEDLSVRLISLPIGPHLGYSDVNKVIEVMNAAIYSV